MTDKVVYTTEHAAIYVIQYRTENGDWADSYPTYYTKAAAVESLGKTVVTPYPKRIVERT